MDDLGKIRRLHLGTCFDPPIVRVQLPHNHLNQGGFSRAVVTEKGNALASLHLEGHAVKQPLVPEGFGEISNPQHLIAVELGSSETGVHLPRLGRLGGGAHAFDPPLNIDGPAVSLVHTLKGPQPQLVRRLFQLLDLSLLLQILLHPLLIAALLLHGVKAVVPAVKLRFAVLDLYDPGHHPV